jgi:hypothetical protein
MGDEPVDLDKYRGMAAQKATDIRRVVADVESHAEELRERQKVIEDHIVAEPAASWPDAAAKARYVLNLYAASLDARDTRHRQLIEAVIADFTRLSNET